MADRQIRDVMGELHGLRTPARRVPVAQSARTSLQLNRVADHDRWDVEHQNALHDFQQEGAAMKHDGIVRLMESNLLGTPGSAESSPSISPWVSPARTSRRDRLRALEALMELEHDSSSNSAQHATSGRQVTEAEQLHDEVQRLAEENLWLSEENTRLRKLAEENAVLTSENSKLRAEARQMLLHQREAASQSAALREENARLSKLPLQNDRTVQEVLEVSSGDHRSMFVQKMVRLRLHATQYKEESEYLRQQLQECKEVLEVQRAVGRNEALLCARSLDIIYRRAVARMLGSDSLCIFAAWSSNVRDARRLRTAATRVVRRIQSRLACMAMNAWCEHVASRKHAAHAVHQRQRVVVARMIRQAAVAALNSWSLHVAMKKRAAGVVRWCVARILHGSISMAWSSWSDWTKTRRRQQRVASTILVRMRNQLTSRGMESWKHYAFVKRQMKARGEAIVTRALVGILRGLETRVFVTWKQVAQHHGKAARVVARVIARMRLSSIVGAWEAWVCNVREAKRMRATLSKIVGRMKMSAVVGAWLTWVSTVEEAKRMRVAATKIVGRIRMSSIVGAWEAWVCNVREAKRMRVVAGKVVSQMQNHLLYAVMNTWRLQMEWKRKTRQVGRVVVARMQLSTTTAAWRAWCDWVWERVHNRATVQKVLLRMQSVQLYDAFASWLSGIRWARRSRSVVMRCLQQMRNTALLGAWLAWVATVDEKVRLRAIVGKILARMTNRTLAAAFHRWAQASDERRRLHKAGEKIVFYLQNHLASAVFNTWCEFYNRRRVSQAIGAKAVSHLQTFAIRAIWKRWLLEVERSRAAHLLTAQAEHFDSRMESLLNFQLEGQRQRDLAHLIELCFVRWSDETTSARREQEQLTSLTLHTMRRCLARWRVYVADTVSERLKDAERKSTAEAAALKKQLVALHASTRLRQQELEMRRRGLEERARLAEDRVEHTETVALQQVKEAEEKARNVEDFWQKRLEHSMQMIDMAKQVAARPIAAPSMQHLPTPPQPPPPAPMTPPRSSQRPPWRPAGHTPLSSPAGVGETRSTVLDMRTDGSMLVSPARAGTNGSPSRDRRLGSADGWNTPPRSGGSSGIRRRVRQRASSRAAVPTSERVPSSALSVAVAAALAEEIEAAAETQSDLDLKERVQAWVARKSP